MHATFGDMRLRVLAIVLVSAALAGGLVYAAMVLVRTPEPDAVTPITIQQRPDPPHTGQNDDGGDRSGDDAAGGDG